MCGSFSIIYFADMAELADAQDLGSCGAIRVGSSPTIRTKKVHVAKHFAAHGLLVFLMTLRKYQGFTILEVLIALALMGILAAAAIPAGVDILQGARERVALTNCREAVLVASLIALDEQILTGLPDPGQLDTPATRSEVLETAGISGQVLTVQVSIVRGSVTYLEYRTPDDVLAIYDAAQKPPYYIAGDEHTGAPDYRRSADEILLASDILETLSQRNEQTQALQILFLDSYGGSYPSLTAEEQEILQSGGFAETGALNWRPILSATGKLVLAASDAPSDKPNPLGPMVYYEGNYYYWQHYGRIKTVYISDQSFDVSLLDPERTEPPSSAGVWLCYDGL